MANDTFRSTTEGLDTAARDLGAKVSAKTEQAANTVMDAMESGRASVAGGIASTADSIRSAADRVPGSSKVKEFAGGTARILDDTAKYLREKDAKAMLSDLETRTKANPIPFLLGALAVGFLAGRAIRRA